MSDFFTEEEHLLRINSNILIIKYMVDVIGQSFVIFRSPHCCNHVVAKLVSRPSFENQIRLPQILLDTLHIAPPSTGLSISWFERTIPSSRPLVLLLRIKSNSRTKSRMTFDFLCHVHRTYPHVCHLENVICLILY